MIRPWKGCSPLYTPFVCPACRSSNPSCILGCKNWWNIHGKWAWSCLRVQLNHNNFASFPGVFIFSVPKGSQLMLDREAAQDCPREFCLALGCFVALLYLILSTLCRSDTSFCELRVIPNLSTRDVFFIGSSPPSIYESPPSAIVATSHRFDLPFNWEINVKHRNIGLRKKEIINSTMNLLALSHLGDIPTWKIIPNGFKSLDNLLALIRVNIFDP